MSTPNLKRQRKKWNTRRVNVTCGCCPRTMSLPVYRVWIARNRGDLIYCSPKCQKIAKQMKLGLPPGDFCCVVGCDGTRARKGLCWSHYTKHAAGATFPLVREARDPEHWKNVFLERQARLFAEIDRPPRRAKQKES